MGLMSWFFPSPEDKVAKARRLLDGGRPADARDELLGIDHPDAEPLRLEAARALCRKNLEAAASWASAGDEERVALHLQLAEELHPGGLEGEFERVRREVREQRTERESARARERAEREARLLAVDPLGISGRSSLLQPHGGEVVPPEEADELEARLALLLDGYPSDLRDRFAELGPAFARAVLDLDDERPDLALQALLALPDDEPLVQFERARCAHALGDPAASARALREFARLAGSHRPIAGGHSGVLLAQMLAEAGDVPAAIRELRALRATAPDAGGVLFAQLLEATGALAEAEQVVTGLIRNHPRQQELYKLLARVRLRGGKRVDAMRALEASMEVSCGTPGRCGYQPPDPDLLRSLATLYLEDGLEIPRALELVDQLQAVRGDAPPTWEDAYLRALVARRRGEAEAPVIRDALLAATPEDDPRRARAALHLS